MGYSSFRTGTLAQFLKRNIGRFTCSSVKSFVFAATAGRTGTKTLSNLCAAVPNCSSFHEPAPTMNGEILAAYHFNQDHLVSEAFRRFKLPAIYKAAADQKHYVETNHIYIKCFSELAVAEFGKKLKVIHLQRDKHAVARSWFKWSAIPGKGFQGPWLPDPFAPKHLISYRELIHSNPQFNHEYLKCLWYWYEIEARVLLFKVKYPYIPVYELKTEDLSNAEILIPLFYQIFGKFETHHLLSKIGTRSHSSKEAPKKPVGVDQGLIDDFNTMCSSKLANLQSKVLLNLATKTEDDLQEAISL